MEEQAPYIVATATTPAALVPYVAVLQAGGFQVEDWAPSSHPSLYSTYQPQPQVFYFCDLVVVEEEVHAWLVLKRADAPAFRLFHWMRVDTPAELRWLLQRNVSLAQARVKPKAELRAAELPVAALQTRPSQREPADWEATHSLAADTAAAPIRKSALVSSSAPPLAVP
jgi:hypothetical protein